MECKSATSRSYFFGGAEDGLEGDSSTAAYNPRRKKKKAEKDEQQHLFQWRA
jgi:hypothetical protein